MTAPRSENVPIPDRENAVELDAYQKETVTMLEELQRLARPWRFLAWRRLAKTIRARNALMNEALMWRQAERAAGRNPR